MIPALNTQLQLSIFKLSPYLFNIIRYTKNAIKKERGVNLPLTTPQTNALTVKIRIILITITTKIYFSNHLSSLFRFFKSIQAVFLYYSNCSFLGRKNIKAKTSGKNCDYHHRFTDFSNKIN